MDKEKAFLKYLTNQNDIELFMVKNFIKPDPTSPNTTNETDEGVIFLKKLKGKGLIEYNKEALSHVNYWHVDGGNNPKNKRWFDTLHEPLLVNAVKLKNTVNKNYIDERLPLQNSQITPITPQRITNHIGTKFCNIFKNISITTIIEMIIAGLIVGALIYYWHLNKIRA